MRTRETRISRFAVMVFSRDEEERDCVALILPGKHVVFQVVSAKPLETSWSTDPPGTTYDLLQRNGVHRGCTFRTAVAQPVPVQRGMSTREREITVLLSICSWNTSEPRVLGTLGYPNPRDFLFRERAISKIHFYDRILLLPNPNK